MSTSKGIDMRRIPIVIGLALGDEGKGTITDFLVSEHKAKYVVRFSGGPQTAHNVVTSDGRHHTFSQFGSGTFQGAGTIISEHMLVNPFNMVGEAEHLIHENGSNPFLDTMIDANALMITPIHVEANRQREINRGIDRHGSCGEGIGETRGFSIPNPVEAVRVADMASPDVLRGKLEYMIAYFMQEIPGFSFGSLDSLLESYAAVFEDIFQYVLRSNKEILEAIRENKDFIVFEGSQGVLLDEAHGFHPHTTWSDTTNSKALKVLSQAGIKKEDTETIGIIRTYLTRHGDGPFPTQFEQENWTDKFPELHNETGRWQGDFLGGHFDLELARYANAATGGVDSIALTHCDRNPESIVMDYIHGMYEPQTRAADDSFDREYRQEISDYVQRVKREEFIWEHDVDVEKLVNIINDHIATVIIKSNGVTKEDKVWN